MVSPRPAPAAAARPPAPVGSLPRPLAPPPAIRPPARSSLHTARARAGTRGGALELLEATGGVVGARGGRDSAGPCSMVAHGAAGVSDALGEGGGALRGAFARVHSVRIKISVNISVLGCAYTTGTVANGCGTVFYDVCGVFGAVLAMCRGLYAHPYFSLVMRHDTAVHSTLRATAPRGPGSPALAVAAVCTSGSGR